MAMAFHAPAAAVPHGGHATAAPLTSSSWKYGAAFFSSSKLSGGVSGQRLRFATAAHALAPATALPAPFPPPKAEYLAAEFSGHGVTFEAVGDSCVVKMTVRNGSAAHLLLPSGLVTSYKPAMWHGAATEVLHTTVGEGPGGMPVIRGGVSMDLRCARAGEAPSSWSPGGAWSLRDVRGGPTGSIEVELVSVEPPGKGDGAEARCVVTLSPEALASELTVTNAASSLSPVALSGAVSNHLRVSTPDATYAVGLQGSDYRSREPMLSEFSILPPDSAQPHWAKSLDIFLSGEGAAAAVAQEPEGEEEDDYKHLTAELCRIYSHAPGEFTVIDRIRPEELGVLEQERVRGAVRLQPRIQARVVREVRVRVHRASDAEACGAGAWSYMARGSMHSQPKPVDRLLLEDDDEPCLQWSHKLFVLPPSTEPVGHL